jgi:hypothetical protein
MIYFIKEDKVFCYEYNIFITASIISKNDFYERIKDGLLVKL